MALPEFLNDLENLAKQAVDSIQSAVDRETLEKVRIEFLGAKKGLIKEVQKGLGLVDKSDKPTAGKRFNEIKNQIEATFENALASLSRGTGGANIAEQFDPTLPGVAPRLGHIHPITQTIEELTDIMGRLGFNVVEGPEVEDLWHNFDALNIPMEHPARDPLDNFYLATAEKTVKRGTVPTEHSQWMLRSQTSTVQVRTMENIKPPVRIISLGRVYRPDTADATHYPMFHQIEGLLVAPRVTMADLKSILHLFAESFFEDDVQVRFRPSFFPFTEPSVEVDMEWDGKWIEFGGAGMVDPNVLSSVGYDPEEVSGFAFGLGIERVCMRRFGITDIRELYRNDVRFLEQF